MKDSFRKKIIDNLQFDELSDDEKDLWRAIGEVPYKLLKEKYDGLTFHLTQLERHYPVIKKVLLEEMNTQNFGFNPHKALKCLCGMSPQRVRRIIGKEEYDKLISGMEKLFN